MRYALVCIGILLLHAQETPSETPSPQANTATILYSLGDLEKMNKIELTRIYVSKLTRLYRVMQYLPFAKLEPRDPNELKIPSVSANEKSMQKIDASVKDYTATLEANLTTIIPYADKKQIIDAILFLQAIMNKVELVGLGMTQLIY